MMNLEDKIIAYLDGTLDETSRAELLHTLSVSPEKRKLLEEHIKLREIISLGHKPASVPLMTERKLADRIPILMQELPYLAEKSSRIAPLVAPSSTSYFTLLGRQVSSFFTSRVGQAVSLGTLALIGGMSWYMAQSNGDEQAGATVPVATQHESIATAPSSSDNSVSTEAERSANSSIIDPATSVARSSASSNLLNATSSSPKGRTNIESKSALKNDARSNDLQRADIADETKYDGGLASASASKSEGSVDGKSVDNSVDASKEATNGSSTDEAKKITDTQSSDANRNIKDPSELPPLPLPSKERNVTGRFVAQADYSGSFTVRPNVKAQEYETTSGIGSPVLGVGYEFNDKWAVGLEGGKSSLSQQQQERVETPQRFTPGPAGNQISVADRITYSTDVKDVEALWSQATIRYTVNPNALFRLEFTGGAGAAFVDGVAPMVSLGSALTYDLSEVIAITGGVTARGAWLSGVNAEDEPTTTLGGGNAKAVVSHRPATSDLFSSSIAGRLGIRVGF